MSNLTFSLIWVAVVMKRCFISSPVMSVFAGLNGRSGLIADIIRPVSPGGFRCRSAMPSRALTACVFVEDLDRVDCLANFSVNRYKPLSVGPISAEPEDHRKLLN